MWNILHCAVKIEIKREQIEFFYLLLLTDEGEVEEEAIDAYELMPAVDILEQLPADFYDKIVSYLSISMIKNLIGGIMVSMFASSAVDRGFECRSGLTKD